MYDEILVVAPNLRYDDGSDLVLPGPTAVNLVT